MARNEIETRFAAWRGHGDAQALGRVFDLAVPELLALARRLAPDEASAEDLVQVTLLTAIERAAKFDASAELMPWLVGILTNKAKLARALRAREVTAEPAPEGEGRDAALEAECAEFLLAVENALERLPAKYRDVLRGYLARGKKPDELARELGRAPGTVRVQLHRGLKLLRKFLPASFALGLGVTLAPRGLSAVRTAVLKHGRLATGTGVAASTSLTLGGLPVFSKLTLLATATAILAAMSWFFASARDPLTHAPPPLAFPASARVAAGRRAAEPEPATMARTIVPPAPRARGGDEPYGSLELELLWHDGTPAADVGLELVPRGESVPNQHRVALRTDTNGRANVVSVHEGGVLLYVDGVGSIPELGLTVARGTANSAQIALPRGVDVSGRVIAADHQPVANATVWFGARGLGTRSIDGPVAIASSGADGRFSIRSVRADGRIFATSAALGWCSPVAISADPEATTSAVELVLEPQFGSVEGVVRDADAAPIEGARVELRPAWRLDDASDLVLPAYATRTDVLGRYAFRAAPVRQFALVAVAGAHPPARQTGDLERAANLTLDLILPRGVCVHGTARDATGEPLVGVTIMDARSPSGPTWRSAPYPLSTRSAADGSFRIDGIEAGRVALEAHVTLAGERRSLAVEIQAGDGSEHEWNPSFHDGLAIAGVLNDTLGAPLVGWEVRASPVNVDAASCPQPVHTDAEGRFRFRNLESGRHRLFAFQPERDAWRVKLDDVEPPREDVVLVATPAEPGEAFVEGTLVSAGGEPLAGMPVTVVHERGGSGHGTSDANGRYHVGPLQPGNHTARVQPRDKPSLTIDVPGLAAGETRDLGQTTVPGTGRIHATITLADGGSLTRPFVMLAPFGYLAPQGSTEFESPNLYPGTYRIVPLCGNAVTEVREVTIVADETTSVEVRLEPGFERRFHLQGAVGDAPIGPAHYVVHRSGGALVLDLVLDLASNAPGVVGWFGAGFAPGSYRLEVTAADGRSVVHDFTVLAEDHPQSEPIPFPSP